MRNKRKSNRITGNAGFLTAGIACMHFAVLLRRHPYGFFKNLRKVGLGRKSGTGGDLRDGMIGADQQLLAGLQTPGGQIADRGLPDACSEGVGQVIFIDMRDFRQGVQGDVLGIVGINVTLGEGAFFRDLEGGVGDDGQIQLPRNKNEKHLQYALADKIVSRFFFAEFLKHQPGIVHEAVLRRSIAVMAEIFPDIFLFAVTGKGKAVHAEDDIFHRIVGHGFFRMFHVGVDDHKIVRLYRYEVIFDVENAASVDDVKKLGKMMRMGKALPVAFVFGNGNIAEIEVQF